MKLFSQHYPDNAIERAKQGQSPVIIIPGLFGSTSNWRNFARKMSEQYPVIVIDQRNHGRSPHADSHSFYDMAHDLHDFVNQNGFTKVIPCGHSMGGKTAMLFSLLFPKHVDRLVVLDIAPIRYSHSHAPFLDALMAIDLSALKSRNEADQAVQQAIPDPATRLFMLQSLTGTAGAYHWRLNLSVLRRFMSDIVDFPNVPLGNKSSNIAALFVAGDQSDYLSNEKRDRCRAYFPDAEFLEIEDAGHWLHIDQPKAVLDALLNYVLEKK